jgi:hypothetical protein
MDSLVSNDTSRARDAAYSLVARSPKKGSSLDPRGTFSSLAKEQLPHFKQELSEILERTSGRFVTTISARRLPRKSRQPYLIEITAKASRVLSFDLDGEKVIIGPDFPTRITKHNLVFGCPAATRMVKLEFEQGDGIDCVFEAKATFLLDWRYKLKEVPAMLFFGGAAIAQNVPLEPVTPSG